MTKKLGPEDRVTVRTTFRPDQDMEMTATEAEDLRRQGLLAKVDQETEKEPETRQRPVQAKAKGGIIRPGEGEQA